MKKTVKGFTLIELMIVVAIIGILASVALPAYQGYTIRAQLVEAMTLADEIKININEYYKFHGSFPAQNEAAGVPEPQYLIGNYVSKMEVEDGAIHVTLGNKINKQLEGKILSFQPLVVTGSPLSPISWICGYASPPEGMQAVGTNRTDIDRRLNVIVCR